MPNVDSTIRELVTSKKVVLFMKGSRHFPQCGFSAQVVEILNKLVPSYETVNVLSDPEMREGIKRFSDWPTIPQLYVDGKFVGGCDIIKEMFANGELAETLGVAGAPPAAAGAAAGAPPTVHLSARAAKEMEAAREAPTDDLRLVISASFEHELFFDGAQPGDVVVDAGSITMRMDPETARRASGLRIDYLESTPGGGPGGFKIDNPLAPPRAPAVRSITPKALRAALDGGEALSVFDVRTDAERAIAHLAEAIAMNDEGQRRLAASPKDAKLVFMCHHGMRSRVAAEAALRQGFTNVWNLEGGIDAWSSEVDASVPRY
jgi:monothiol glutaredoxin